MMQLRAKTSMLGEGETKISKNRSLETIINWEGVDKAAGLLSWGEGTPREKAGDLLVNWTSW